MLLSNTAHTMPVIAVQAKEAWDLSDGEKVALAQKRKEHGNALFKASKWARAIAKYKSAAEAVGFDVRRSLILQHSLCTVLESCPQGDVPVSVNALCLEGMPLHTALAGGCSCASARLMQ